MKPSAGWRRFSPTSADPAKGRRPGLLRRALGGGLTALALVAAGCSPELDWRELRSEPGRFVAALPGRPIFEERELSGEPGVVMHLWSARAGDAVYGIGYADRASTDRSLVERTRDTLAANIGGRLVEDKDVALGPARGREFTAEGADTALVARLLVVGPRLYQLAVIGKKGAIEASAVDTFFSSFRLHPEPD
jgi:hypothetical protein